MSGDKKVKDKKKEKEKKKDIRGGPNPTELIDGVPQPRCCGCKRKICIRITWFVVPVTIIALLVILPFTLLAEDPSMMLVIEVTRSGERSSSEIFQYSD